MNSIFVISYFILYVTCVSVRYKQFICIKRFFMYGRAHTYTRTHSLSHSRMHMHVHKRVIRTQ